MLYSSLLTCIMFCFGAGLLLFYFFKIIMQFQLHLNTNCNLLENTNQAQVNVTLNNLYKY